MHPCRVRTSGKGSDDRLDSRHDTTNIQFRVGVICVIDGRVKTRRQALTCLWRTQNLDQMVSA